MEDERLFRILDLLVLEFLIINSFNHGKRRKRRKNHTIYSFLSCEIKNE